MPEIKDAIYRPRDRYTQDLKKKYHMAAEQYFDMLGRDSETNAELNELHVKQYLALCEKVENAEKNLAKVKRLRAFLIFLTIFSFVAAVGCLVGWIFCIRDGYNQLWWLLLVCVGFIGLGVLWIILIKKPIKRKLLSAQKILEDLIQKRDAALALCYQDMAKLNELFDWNMPAVVMEKCTPIIDLDPFFEVSKYHYLEKKFGLNVDGDEDTSNVGILSGNIHGNPFVLQKTFNNNFCEQRYDGELTYSWTTTHTGKNGTYTVTHTDTLHASVYHDAPHYSYLTKLIYGNEAAPNLRFSRSPSGGAGKSGKDLDKFIEKKTKEMQKLADKAMKNGTNFVKLGNDKFDALFNCTDRDNEVEFRLLFTPLAQTNMIGLMENPTPFGDDFRLIKNKMVNVVISNHSQRFDYNVNPNYFMSYSFKESRQKFIDYCDEFIESLYFDLAPLMSIPLYQLHMPHEYIYEKSIESYLANPEHEVMANAMDHRHFYPDNCDKSLPLMLKTSFLAKDSGSDKVKVHSYSYHTTPMVDYVTKRGKDGRLHDVPVHWTKYDRVDTDVEINVRQVNGTRQQYNNGLDKISNLALSSHYERGLLGVILNSKSGESLRQALSSIFNKK